METRKKKIFPPKAVKEELAGLGDGVRYIGIIDGARYYVPFYKEEVCTGLPIVCQYYDGVAMTVPVEIVFDILDKVRR